MFEPFNDHKSYICAKALLMRTITFLLILLSGTLSAQEAITKRLGKFGATDLSMKEEVDGGRELAYLYISFQNAEAPSDAIDIGGLMLTDSLAAREFANHLTDALAQLGAKRGRKQFEGKAYVLKATAGENRIALYGKGRFAAKYALLTELQATKLAEAVRRHAGAIRN